MILLDRMILSFSSLWRDCFGIRDEAEDIYIAGADPGAKPLPVIASADSSVQLRLVLAVSYDVSSLIFVRDQPYLKSR